MKRMPVSEMTDNQLVERFLVIALEQDRVERMDEPVSKYNRLYDKLKEVEAELKARPGDLRALLLPLYEHDNLQVQLRAALATLTVAPEASRAVLQRLSDRNRYPQAADAREMMEALDDGSYVPN